MAGNKHKNEQSFSNAAKRDGCVGGAGRRTREGARERHGGLAELLLRAHLPLDLPQQLIRLHVLEASLVRRLGHWPRQLRALRSFRRARRANRRATAGASALREHWLRLLRLQTARAGQAAESLSKASHFHYSNS